MHWKPLVSVLIICCSLAGCESESRFPDRPITFVCPWAPGGGTDQVSRQMAFYLEQELGVPCTVINATGGQGVTGHRRSLTARPDGYTIGTITFELNTLHHQGLTTLTYEDMIPLISVNEDAAAIWVSADADWNSLGDLVEFIQQHPKKLSASGTATGGAWHLAFAGWLQAAGLPTDSVKWIPKGGADPSIQELLSGGIDLVCCSLPEAKAAYDRGDLKSLGVMAEGPVPGFEEIPTMKQQGYDWVLVGWRGFAVPKGTPPDRVHVLRQAMEEIVKGNVKAGGNTFPGFMQQQGFNNHWRKSDDFRRFLAQNDEALGALLHSDAFRSLAKGAVGPYDFPKLLGGVLCVLIAIQVFVVYQGQSSERRDSVINVAAGLAAVVAYLLLAETVGFVILAGVILFLLLWRLGTKPVTSLVITVLLVPCIYQLFAVILRVPLPRGWWGW